MHWRIPLLLAVLALLGCGSKSTQRPAIDPAKVIDLSHPFGPDTIYWPTAQPFELRRVAYGRTPQGYFYAANNISMAEHGGTHMDAPIHFAEGKRTSDQVPLANCIGPAAVIDVISGLDRFLIAIVLLYFAYGVYSLFIHPEEPEENLAIPAWLRVKQIGQLKQVVAEVIIVILFVLFLRIALQTYRDPGIHLTWLELAALALLPVSTVLLALALRLVELHPKPARPPVDAEENAAPAPREKSAKLAPTRR